MADRRWRTQAVFVVLVTVVVFILPYVLVLVGAQEEIAPAVSDLSLLALLLAFVLIVISGDQRIGWSLVLAGIALAAEIGAALLLLVHEPQPAYLYPEWAWYWLVVNELYVGGLLVGLVALASTVLAVVTFRRWLAVAAAGVLVAALIVNRIAPYR